MEFAKAAVDRPGDGGRTLCFVTCAQLPLKEIPVVYRGRLVLIVTEATD